jgi:hypothetical protein
MRRKRKGFGLGIAPAIMGLFGVMAAQNLLPAATVGAPVGVDDGGGGPGVPFVRASYQYREKIRTDTVVLSTSQQTLQPVPITPGGFLRGIWLELDNTVAGALGTAVLGTPTDFPYSMIASITLEDVNGQSIVGPISGYELYLANKYGGYFPDGDPTVQPGFVGTFVDQYFTLWLPCEIRSDGLGSLANTDARAQYRLVVTIDSQPNITSTGTITTQPTFTVQYWVDYWAQVEKTNMAGEPNEQKPPLLGTTQFWTREVPVVAAAAQTVKHNRVGNAIRNIIYVLRSGAAATGAVMANPRVTNYNDPIKLRLDNRYLLSESPFLRRRGIAARLYDLTGPDGDPATIGTPSDGILETGTLVYPQSGGMDYKPGPGDVGDWLDTNEASFLQFEDTLNATVATLTILTNDVAPPPSG